MTDASLSDPLRDRIARLDPTIADDGIEPLTSASARALLEEIMRTPSDIDDTIDTPDPGSTPSTIRTQPENKRRQWWIGAGAAAAIIAFVAIGAAALSGTFDGDDTTSVASNETGDSPTVTEPPAKLKVLELSTGEVDPTLQSCIQMTPEIIAGAEVAFRAIVDTANGEIVTMTIDQWYTGGDAQVVTLTAPAGMEALIGGIDFRPGQPYLVTATSGVVNYCGMSGAATPELQALFDQAFPG
jgi:hypothetical protein